MTKLDRTEGMLLGLAVGDALGIPHEFRQRSALAQQPVTGMQGHGAHNQPAGTWSDDTSLTALLCESLIAAPQDKPPYVDIVDLGRRFVDWYDHGVWTAHGEVFDVGMTTRAAILAIASELEPYDPTEFNDRTQGNGSLMRVLPLALRLPHVPSAELFRAAREVSAVTHGHPVCAIACYLLVEFGRLLVRLNDPFVAYGALQLAAADVFTHLRLPATDTRVFERVLTGKLLHLAEDDIETTGYVVHTLEAALWCILHTTDYRSAVLRAVNLGDDADTTASVAGGLAGLHYGVQAIPADWLATLARTNDLRDLAQRLQPTLP